MRGLIVWLSVLPAVAQLRWTEDLLLPEWTHVSGVVVDSHGMPVTDAGIYTSNDDASPGETDLQGRFEISTRAPTIVFRKAGFRTGVLRTRNASNVHVTLLKLDRPQFPTCAETGALVGISWGRLRFPKTRGVRYGEEEHTTDTVERVYYIKDARKGIRHGSGPSWGAGLPRDSEVWRSATYEEAVYQADRTAIIDARGTFAGGSHWRSLGMFGETATYDHVDAATAAILDRFLDRACMKQAPGPH